MTVRAAMCRSYGPPEVVTVEDVPEPGPGEGQVVVTVRAAAVNFPDVLLVANRYQVSVPTPFVPGSEFAGVVSATGPGVTGWRAGDRVTGVGMVGAFAERVVVAAGSLNRIPDGYDDRLAAAGGVTHRSAQHALRTLGRLRPGEELVVLGASGGVGLAAVQLGVAMGATVTAVASSAAKLAVAERYGATRLLDHRRGELRASLKNALPDGADVVVDPVGGDLAEPALRALRPGGRFVTVGFAAGAIPRIPLNLVLVKDIEVLGLNMRTLGIRAAVEFARHEDELASLLATGRVVPHIGAVFPLDDTAAALRVLADGRAVGKVVLDL